MDNFDLRKFLAENKLTTNSKLLKENTFKVGQKVTYLGHPAVVTATKEYNGRNFVSVSYDKGTGKTKASDILVKSGVVKPLEEGTLDQVGVNEAFTPSSIFTKDPNNPNFLKITIPYDVGSGFSTALGKRTMSGQTRDMGSKTAMIKANQIAKQLESMFDLEDIDVTDQQNGKVEIFAVSDDFESKSSSEIKAELNTLMNEEKIEVDKDTKFQLDLTHLLDKHVVKEIAEEVMKEKGYSKYLVSKDNPKGETPGLTDDVLSKILMKIGDEVKETIELGKNLEEGKLCPKGEAYRKRRMAAGEKSSAYLSGRAVKVCKGQMSGKKKKKK